MCVCVCACACPRINTDSALLACALALYVVRRCSCVCVCVCVSQVTAYLPIEAQGLGGQHALTGTTPATPVLALEAPSTSGSGQPASAGVSVSAADSNGSTGGAPGTALALRGIRRIPTGIDTHTHTHTHVEGCGRTGMAELRTPVTSDVQQ